MTRLCHETMDDQNEVNQEMLVGQFSEKILIVLNENMFLFFPILKPLLKQRSVILKTGYMQTNAVA